MAQKYCRSGPQNEFYAGPAGGEDDSLASATPPAPVKTRPLVKAVLVASTTEPEQLCVIDADGVQTCSDVISVEAVEEPSTDSCEPERPRRRRRPAQEEE